MLHGMSPCYWHGLSGEDPLETEKQRLTGSLTKPSPVGSQVQAARLVPASGAAPAVGSRDLQQQALCKEGCAGDL